MKKEKESTERWARDEIYFLLQMNEDQCDFNQFAPKSSLMKTRTFLPVERKLLLCVGVDEGADVFKGIGETDAEVEP